MDYYQLVSTSRKRELVSPFCLRGERLAAFYLEAAAFRMATILRDSLKCPTVCGCYRQPNGTWLIGPASARPVGKYRQTLRLRKVSGKLPASVEVWRSVTRRRVVFFLDAFVRNACNARALNGAKYTKCEISNHLQMLCADCNARKSDKF